MPFTEAEMLDDVCMVVTKDKIPVYRGKGAFTVLEVNKRNAGRGFIECETTTRNNLNQQVEEGKLMKVKVHRVDDIGRNHWPLAYVKPEVYVFYTRKMEEE